MWASAQQRARLVRERTRRNCHCRRCDRRHRRRRCQTGGRSVQASAQRARAGILRCCRCCRRCRTRGHRHAAPPTATVLPVSSSSLHARNTCCRRRHRRRKSRRRATRSLRSWACRRFSARQSRPSPPPPRALARLPSLLPPSLPPCHLPQHSPKQPSPAQRPPLPPLPPLPSPLPAPPLPELLMQPSPVVREPELSPGLWSP